MTIKTILVPMNAAQSDRVTLDLALMVARPTNAHIQALFVRPDPRDIALYAGFGSEGFGLGRLMDQVEQEGGELSKRAHKAYDAWCARNDISEYQKARAGMQVSAAWREEVGAIDLVIPRLGGLCDLVVETGILERDFALEETTIEASLFGSARPTLIAPKTLPSRLDATALIAWNGSQEANRAVHAALDMLASCHQVLIFCEPEGARSQVRPAELVDFLGWHGIKARPVTAAKTGASTGADLLATAAREQATLLVMGAYTHGRLREMVLGGVTHHIIHHASIPVLLAH